VVVADTGIAPWPASLQAPYEVIDARSCTPTIRELWLRPLTQSLDHAAGEFVLLGDDERAVPERSYSVANAPRPDGLISLLITRVPGGRTSSWAHDTLRVGDRVVVSGPYGTFLDDPRATAPGLFLAAGSGVAPIRALLEAGLQTGLRASVTMILSARTEADVVSREEFLSLERRHPRFRFIRTLTRASGTPPHGRIPALLPDLDLDLSDHDVFIAGAPGFVQACGVAAEASGASTSRVQKEEFFVDA